jgi:hypothetical protein
LKRFLSIGSQGVDVWNKVIVWKLFWKYSFEEKKDSFQKEDLFNSLFLNKASFIEIGF